MYTMFEGVCTFIAEVLLYVKFKNVCEIYNLSSSISVYTDLPHSPVEAVRAEAMAALGLERSPQNVLTAVA